MPLPQLLETAETHLFTDRDKMIASGVPAVTADHIIRLRDVYNFWLQFPSKRDRDIVDYIMSRGVGRSAAYDDLKVVKTLLGAFQKSSKDWHRYRFLTMIERAYDKAERAGYMRAMVAAADKYAKYTQLDKEEVRDPDWDSVALQRFIFTDNPEVIGIKRLPNLRERKRKMIETYTKDIEDVQVIEAEDTDLDIDQLFEVKKRKNG